MRWRPLLWRTLFIVAVLIVWEVVYRAGLVDHTFVPSPSTMVGAVGPLLTDSTVLDALRETLTSLALSFLIGTGAGIFVGVVLGLQPLLRRAYFPIVMILLGSPKSLFLPVIVLFFGLGQESSIVFGSILAFVHVTVNVVAGIDLVEPKHLTVARAFKAGRWQRFVHVIVPAATPGLFTALWHGIRNGFTGVVIAQLFIGTAGIGLLVRLYSNNLQTDRALTLVMIVSLVVILVGTGWNHVERRMTQWREVETR